MYLKSFFHILPSIDCGNFFAIEGISRSCNFNAKYISRSREFLNSVESKNLAIIYCPPMAIANKDSVGLRIAKLQQIHAHKYAKSVKNSQVNYLELDSSACASSLVGLVKAKNLISSGQFDDVLVIADERITEEVLDQFVDFGIGVKGGDGFASAWLSKSPSESSFVKISDTATSFHYNANPWFVAEEGYQKVVKTNDYEYIKPHGTGTDVNNKAEEAFCRDRVVIGSLEGLSYKEKYGHMQGASGLAELCQMLTDHASLPRTMCLASGLGNFYAGLVVEKKS